MTSSNERSTRSDNATAPVTVPSDPKGGPDFEVRELRRHEFGEAVALLARGMRDNPLHVAAYGSDPERRLHRHERLVRGLFRVFASQQPLCVARDGAIMAATGVAPVGTCSATLGQRLAFLPNIIASGPGTAVRVGKWVSAWAAHDPDYPHVHLGPLAVDADLQGQGIGSLLIREHCQRLDDAQEIGYLETDKAENVRFYERFGYHVIGDAKVLGIPNWFMQRDPVPTQASRTR